MSKCRRRRLRRRRGPRAAAAAVKDTAIGVPFISASTRDDVWVLARSASAADTFVHCEMRGLGKSQDRVILPSLQGRSGRVVGWWRSGCGGWVSTLTFKSCVKPLDGVSTKDEPKPTTWPDFTMFSRTLRKTPTLAQIKGAFWARHLGRLRGHTCPDLLTLLRGVLGVLAAPLQLPSMAHTAPCKPHGHTEEQRWLKV